MTRPAYYPGQKAVFPVKPRSGKKRLSHYLAARLGVVETWAATLLRQGAVVLDGVPATGETLINLSGGSHVIEVTFPEDWPPHMVATEMDLDILYEDDCLVAINKPPGIVVHPARGHLDGKTLQNGLRHRHRHRIGRPDVTIGAPHRLDKDTSGVVIFALTRPVYIELVRQFTAGEPKKKYYALADGVAGFMEHVAEQAIGIDPDHPQRGKLVPVEEGGKTATTYFTVLKKWPNTTLLEARPQTGRPHQIRLHAAGLGLPLIGDKDYNPDYARHGDLRQLLHAAELTFTHPVSGEQMTVAAPMPGDMSIFIERQL
jgi:pseudouridine synthase, RluA family